MVVRTAKTSPYCVWLLKLTGSIGPWRIWLCSPAKRASDTESFCDRSLAFQTAGELLRSWNQVTSLHVAIALSHIHVRENDLIKRPCAQSCPWAKFKSWVGFGVGREITKAHIPICVSYSLSQIKAKTRRRGMNLWSETSFEVLAVLSKNCLTMSNLKTFYVRSEESALAGGEKKKEKASEIFPLSIFRSLLCQLIY